MKRLSENKRTQVTVEFRSGKFTKTDIARRNDISLASVKRITANLGPDFEPLIDAQLSQKMSITKGITQPERTVLNHLVDERSKDRADANTYARYAVKRAMNSLKNDDDMSPKDLKNIVEIVGRFKEITVGKTPEVAIQTNIEVPNSPPITIEFVK